MKLTPLPFRPANGHLTTPIRWELARASRFSGYTGQISGDTPLDDEEEERPDRDDEDEDDAGDGTKAGSRTVSGGACFRRFIYAIRSHDGVVPGRRKAKRRSAHRRRGQVRTAAAQRSGEPWYGIIAIDSILNRAPLHAPFFWDKARQAPWDPERKPAKARGWFLYNDDIAFDLYR